MTAEWLFVIFSGIAIAASSYTVLTAKSTVKMAAEARARNVETWTDCARANRDHADDWRRLGHPDRARAYDELADDWERLVNETKEIR